MKGVHPYRTTLDGSVHAQASQARRDSRRDAHPKKTGYMVLRFSNGIVQEAPDIFVQNNLGRRVVFTGGVRIGRSERTPSPVSHRLIKAPDGSTLSPKGARAEEFGDRALYKCRNSRGGRSPSAESLPALRPVHGIGKALSVRQRINNFRSAFLESGAAKPQVVD